MAQTFRPYQSQGVALNQLNLPQGAESIEASKTMQVLSQGLDRMSQWAFKQANIQAQEAGAKWGVENAPKLADIKKAYKENKNTSDLFEFGNTTFGRYARQSALKTLENEVLLTATNDINDLVFKATQNNTAPSVLENQLNATILGITDPIKASAPELANLLKTKLSLQSAGEFDRYRTSHAKGSVGVITTKGRQAVNNWINTLPQLLYSVLKSGDSATPEGFAEAINTIKVESAKVVRDGGYTKGSAETKINEIDNVIKDWIATQFTDEVFERDLNNEFDIKTPFILIEAIRNNKYTGDDPEAKKIMALLNYINDPNIKAYKKGILVPTIAEIHSKVLANYNTNISNEVAEINLSKKRSEKIKIEKEGELLKIFDKTEPLTKGADGDVNKAEKIIKAIRDAGYPNLADQYSDQLASLKIDNAHPPSSDQATKLHVKEMIKGKRGTYLKLNNFKKSLSEKDYDDFRDQLEASLDVRMDKAKDKIEVAIGFDFALEKFSTLQGDDKANAREAKRVYQLLEDEWITARREGTDFFPLQRVEKLIEESSIKLGDEIRLKALTRSITKINNALQFFKEKAVRDDKEFIDDITGSNNEQTVQNWLNLIESWKGFTRVEDIPEKYRAGLVLDWWNNRANTDWNTRIDQEISTLRKGLPGD
jgi:hypothetical protein